MFQLVNSKNRGDDDDDDNDYTCLDTTLSKWRQIMPDNKLTTDNPNFVVGSAVKKRADKTSGRDPGSYLNNIIKHFIVVILFYNVVQ